METNTEQPQTTPIAAKLIEALIAFYEPCSTPADADDTKSTLELIDEMDPIQDSIFPFEINALMETNGFKLHYNGSGYVWLLKIK